MSQRNELLSYLEEGHKITSLQAIHFMGITRISALIHDLRKDGYNIEREDVQVRNRHGKPTTVGRWFLAEDQVKPFEQQEMFA